jgi:alpha-ribazole phosphatase
VVARVGTAIGRLEGAHGGSDIVVVAHGGSIRAALAHALALDAERALGFTIENCSLTRLDHFAAEGAWRVGSVNLVRRSRRLAAPSSSSA